MVSKAKQADTNCRNPDMDEELADVLIAISVVAKRIARKLMMLSRQQEQKTKGGNSDEQNE